MGDVSRRKTVPDTRQRGRIVERAEQIGAKLERIYDRPTGLHKEARLMLVAKFAMMGMTSAEVAEKLEIATVTAREDLVEVRRRWLESSLVSYDTMKAAELAKVNEIERQQWVELELLGAEGQDEKREAWWAKRSALAYNRIMWCVEQRCKLFGLYAPQEVISWKAEAAQHGYDPDTIYRILVHEMSNIIDGTARPVEQQVAEGEETPDDADANDL